MGDGHRTFGNFSPIFGRIKKIYKRLRLTSIHISINLLKTQIKDLSKRIEVFNTWKTEFNDKFSTKSDVELLQDRVVKKGGGTIVFNNQQK
jgi:hypothetical protein